MMKNMAQIFKRDKENIKVQISAQNKIKIK